MSGTVLATVTVTPADVVLLPAASRAFAVSVCAPFEVADEFQETANGEAVTSAPSGEPSK